MLAIQNWLTENLLDPRVWFAFILFVGKGILLLWQFREHRRNRKLINIDATIGSNGTVQVELANRSESAFSVSNIELVQDKSCWAYLKRKYVLGLERFASMNVIVWRGADKKIKKVKERGSKTRYFEIVADSDEERSALVVELRRSWLRQTMIRVEAGGFRILSKVRFVDNVIATGDEARRFEAYRGNDKA